MSLLSKLLGKKAAEVAKNVLRGIPNDNDSRPAPRPAAQPQPAYTPEPEPSPSGFSWGERMPDEPNQYNFNGTPRQYFEQIYRAEFPGYSLAVATPKGPNYTVFTFYQGDRKALVVELLSKNGGSTKMRTQCRMSGVPYLRFYYNHYGWWNTRAYVVTRTRNTLEG